MIMQARRSKPPSYAVPLALCTGAGSRALAAQTVFFKLSAVMPYEEAVEMLKKSIKKMYGKKAGL